MRSDHGGPALRFGLHVPNFGIGSDPNRMASVARLAESGGWHGLFVWDHIWHGDDRPTADAWGVLAAIACNSTALRIGPLVAPVPRYRPWDLARRAVTIDQLCRGRLILGLGTGTAADFEPFAPVEARRTASVDNGVRILRALLGGGPVEDLDGPAYSVSRWDPGGGEPQRRVCFRPRPVQAEIPLWGAAGNRAGDAPFRRAGRELAGIVPVQDPWTRAEGPLTPEEMATAAERALRFRSPGKGPPDFQIVHIGVLRRMSPGAAGALVAAHRQAGVTWWLEDCEDLMESWEELRRLALRGPGHLIA